MSFRQTLSARSCPVPLIQNGMLRRRQDDARGVESSVVLTGYKVTPGTVLYVECDNNYQTDGLQTSISCVTDTRFSGDLPVCEGMLKYITRR